MKGNVKFWVLLTIGSLLVSGVQKLTIGLGLWRQLIIFGMCVSFLCFGLIALLVAHRAADRIKQATCCRTQQCCRLYGATLTPNR